MSNRAQAPAEEDLEDEELEDDEFDEEGDEEGEYMDMGGLLTSLLTTEDGDNVCTALVNIGNILNKHMETQNKILLKILTKLPVPKEG